MKWKGDKQKNQWYLVLNILSSVYRQKYKTWDKVLSEDYQVEQNEVTGFSPTFPIVYTIIIKVKVKTINE